MRVISRRSSSSRSSSTNSVYLRNLSPCFTEATGGISGCHLLCNGVSCSHGAFFGSTDMIVLTMLSTLYYIKYDGNDAAQLLEA